MSDLAGRVGDAVRSESGELGGLLTDSARLPGDCAESILGEIYDVTEGRLGATETLFDSGC